jgi:hypothetical protein
MSFDEISWDLLSGRYLLIQELKKDTQVTALCTTVLR